MLAALSGILGVLVPVFLVIGVGFVAVRSRYIDPEALQALGTFALRIALPALIFDALTRAPLGETMDRGYLVAYGAGTLAVFALGVVAARRAGRPLDQSAIFGLGMSGSNSGYMGYPIAALVIGPAAGPILAQNMLVENLLLLPMALVLAETSERGGSSLGGVLRDIALSLARNPLLIALALGLAVAGLGLSPPAPIARPIALLGGVAAPVALFVVGGALAGLRRGGGHPRAIAAIVAGKLVLHPLAVLTALLLAPGVDPALFAGGVIFASVPMFSIYPILGARFGVGDLSAAALFVATLLSIVTVTAVILGLERAGLVTLD